MPVLACTRALIRHVCHAEDTPAAPGCDETVHFSRVAQADAHTALRASFLVRGDADAVYETLRDAEKFPEFMPNTDEVTVLEQAEDHQIVSFKGSSGLFKSEVVLRRVADDRSRRISWSLIRGSLKSSDGFWSVEHDTTVRGLACNLLKHRRCKAARTRHALSARSCAQALRILP